MFFVPVLWLSDSRNKAWHVCCLSCNSEQNNHKIRTEINFTFCNQLRWNTAVIPAAYHSQLQPSAMSKMPHWDVLTVLSLTPTDLFLLDKCKVRSLLERPYSIWKFSDGHYWFRHQRQLSKTKQRHLLAGFFQLIISSDKFSRRGIQGSGDLWSCAVWNESVIINHLNLL